MWPASWARPIFAKFAFPNGGAAQYADAMLRATFPNAEGWHTLLGEPAVTPVKITIPAGYGYVLTSKKTGASFAVVDIEFLQKELFQQVPGQEGKLVVAMTHNTAYYTEGDATLCCSWGTHGVDAATGNSFVLGSYLQGAPAVVEDRDVQPLTQQLGEFVNDPLHDPLLHGAQCESSGEHVSGLDAAGLDASGRPGRLRRHGGGHQLLPSGTDQYQPQEQFPGIESLCRPREGSRVSPAERGPAAVVYGRRREGAARTAFPMRRRLASRPSRARRAADVPARAAAGRVAGPRPRRSRRPARRTGTS